MITLIIIGISFSLIGNVLLLTELQKLRDRPVLTAQEIARAVLAEPVPVLALIGKDSSKIWVGITAYEGEDPKEAKEVRNRLASGQVFGKLQWTDGPNVRWDQEIK